MESPRDYDFGNEIHVNIAVPQPLQTSLLGRLPTGQSDLVIARQCFHEIPTSSDISYAFWISA
jgi:hypothetical protein